MTATIQLPPPQRKLAFPLMKALANRRSGRTWKRSALAEQEISNLLWAACGITTKKSRSSKSRRTVPSGCNSQEIRVYVALKKGVFLYDEEGHRLLRTCSRDVRKEIGTQKMMQSAPVGLVLVADLSRITSPFIKSDEAKQFCAAVDTGFISQNIYLYCAAANLSTVVLSLVNREKLHRAMGLSEHEKIVVTQVVGKPRTA